MAIVTCPQCGTKNRVDEQRAQMQTPVCGKCGAELSAASAESNGHPMTFTDANFAQDVLGASKPVLVDCWAAWCGPCRMIAPAIDELAQESAGQYVVGKLNVDENPRIANQLQISSIPTLLIFKNGQVRDRIVGLQPKENIRARLSAVT